MIVEIILITKTRYEIELRTWLNWYLYILGFDKVTVYDNESFIDIKSICDSYVNVTYNQIHGFVNQPFLYEEILKNRINSDVDWLCYLDDDEFLYIGNKYNNNIKIFIEYMIKEYNCNKIGFPIVNFYSKEYLYKRNTEIPLIQSHIYYSNYLPIEFINKVGIFRNNLIKCALKTKDTWSFFKKSREFFRNPKCNNLDYINDAVLENGKRTRSPRVLLDRKLNTNCFVAHYQFRSDEEWKYKCKLGRIKTRNNYLDNDDIIESYKQLYNYCDLFEKCDLIKNKYITFCRLPTC